MPWDERLSAPSVCAGAQTGGKCWGLSTPLPPDPHSPMKIPALIPVKPKGLSVSHPLLNLIVSGSRCLPRGWVRSEIKGGKERSLCSQSPQLSGTHGRKAPLGAHSAILKNWKVSVVWEHNSEGLVWVFFARQGDPNPTGASFPVRLWRQLPPCPLWILTSLAAVTDLQPGLRKGDIHINIKESCSQAE